MKILLFLLLMSSLSFSAFAEESMAKSAISKEGKDSKKGNKKNPLVDSDLNKLQKEVVTEPKFSSVSADQEAIDKDLNKKNEEINFATKMRILEGKKCGKLATREAIVTCQKLAQTSKLDKK